MLKRCSFLALLTFSVNGYGQASPDVFLQPDKRVPKVLLVGSWHFNYPGLDANKTREEDQINIYSPKRQKELNELLNYIAIFRPTKIMVESGPITGYLQYNYKQWMAGKEKLYASERSQVAMRLAHRFGLDTVYGVDDVPLLLDLHYDSTSVHAPYIDSILRRHYFGGTDSISMRYKRFYNYEDKYQLNNTLLNSFKYLNSDKVLNRYFGAYIAGGQFTSQEQEGPDALSMFWLNRNLRIFRNIQRIGASEHDRILVVFGAGHVAILKWLFECSPEYELVKFGTLKKEK